MLSDCVATWAPGLTQIGTALFLMLSDGMASLVPGRNRSSCDMFRLSVSAASSAPGLDRVTVVTSVLSASVVSSAPGLAERAIVQCLMLSDCVASSASAFDRSTDESLMLSASVTFFGQRLVVQAQQLLVDVPSLYVTIYVSWGIEFRAWPGVGTSRVWDNMCVDQV